MFVWHITLVSIGLCSRIHSTAAAAWAVSAFLPFAVIYDKQLNAPIFVHFIERQHTDADERYWYVISDGLSVHPSNAGIVLNNSGGTYIVRLVTGGHHSAFVAPKCRYGIPVGNGVGKNVHFLTEVTVCLRNGVR